jgi:hypothetical protein
MGDLIFLFSQKLMFEFAPQIEQQAEDSEQN